MVNAVENSGRTKDKLFNFRPAFFAAIALIVGILFAYYRLKSGVSWRWLVLLVPVLVAPLFFCEGRRDFVTRLLTVLLLGATVLLGCICFRYQLYDYSRCGYYNGEHTVTGTVVSYVDSGEYFRLTLGDIHVDGEEENGLLNAYLPYSYAKDVRIADVVLIQGKVRTDTSYFDEHLRSSAINDEVRFSLQGATAYQQVGRSKDIFLLIRSRIETVVFGCMDKTSASVALAVLTGDTSKIEVGLLNNMRMGGIAHIFAVSGLHVGALYGFILLLFSKTRLRTLNGVFRFLMLAATLLFYAGICGFSPSIVRAITLCLVGYCLRWLGGAADGLNTLGLAAIIILLVTPCALFEIGFQLSFAACLGIVLFAKRIGQVCDELYKFFRKVFPRRYTAEEEKMLKKGDTLPLTVGERCYRAVVSVMATSLAAQIFTVPLQYLAFGYLSGWAFLLNLIFVPLISVAFAGLLVLVLLSCLLPLWCGKCLLYILAMLLNAGLLVFEVADFSTFAITTMQLSKGCCVCYYGGVIFLTDKWNLSKRQGGMLSAVCFVAFAVILALLNL